MRRRGFGLALVCEVGCGASCGGGDAGMNGLVNPGPGHAVAGCGSSGCVVEHLGGEAASVALLARALGLPSPLESSMTGGVPSAVLSLRGRP